MPRCGCSGTTACSCLIVAGENASISGSGSVANPYLVNSIYSGSGLPAATMERYEANQSVVTGTQNLRLEALTAREGILTTGVRMSTSSPAATATPTIIRIGLYTVNAAGDGVLVASTPNDLTLFTAINTFYSKNWSTPYQLVMGNRYAVGLLVVSAVTTPSMLGAAQGNSMQTENLVLPWCAAVLAGQANLPSSFLYASLTTSVNAAYARLLG